MQRIDIKLWARLWDVSNCSKVRKCRRCHFCIANAAIGFDEAAHLAITASGKEKTTLEFVLPRHQQIFKAVGEDSGSKTNLR